MKKPFAQMLETKGCLSWLGQLKFFGIAPVQHRESYNNRSRKYYVQDFEDAFSRYIPASIRDSVTNKALSDVNCHSVTPCDGVDDLPDMGF